MAISLHVHVHCRCGHRRRRDLRGRRRGRRQRLAERQAHGGDFLLLVDDDLLRDAAQLFVVAIAQFGQRHVDGALMMRDHHGDEVGVDVAGRLDRHARHHLVHGGVVFGQK